MADDEPLDDPPPEDSPVVAPVAEDSDAIKAAKYQFRLECLRLAANSALRNTTKAEVEAYAKRLVLFVETGKFE